MKQILHQRQIDTLYHFTQAENLQNIFKHGLLPRNILEKNSIPSHFNDEYRYDNCIDAICMSIEFPNYKMFYKLRQEDTSVDWVVLKLNAQILCDYSCAYCWTNAGDTSMYNTPLEERMGTAAFLELFEDRPLFPKRNTLNIPDWFPTNPQAEVLVFGSIPIDYIENVYFENYNSLLKHKNIIPTGISYNIKTEVFKYRKDWSFW